mmetsp:Transcript_31086/g.69027  ORF Transcript_31086/g.69027 Transcript_31086/m.69027 type:complete len:131 (+) Transcript_31086:91-483(+)|eukprot:CAMPEP_0202900668 /NCGR_PEP_ID=MMETSP1392-20130828/11970_1 /ASSEMBLY_ACC=CAM_ASM_000868 /TAXON_ID=225041 /ORGANISM="Chlamydomonas chlamydogama, Strain SAG 11-48b" /LENGTH=130 /DNA_ID=CAMNT_0049587105 /DNA_START=88 /DNA_END=480 /DNA_ORIENTATION=+
MADREEQDKHAVLELQDRMLMQHDMHRRVLQSERATTMQKQRRELMLSEIKALPDNTKTYQGVGKAYFLAPKPAVVKDTEDSISTAGAELESLKQKRVALEQKMKETENELRELIKHNPQLVRALGGTPV